MSGHIVLLNGVPRSGKSSIARALQGTGLWVNLGVDAMMGMTPERFRPGIGLRPGGERPDLEPVVRQLYAGLFEAIRGMAQAGLDVVSDIGLHADYAVPYDPLAEGVRTLRGLPVLFVGVRCSIETIMARRNADPQGGFYAAGPDVPAPVRRWQEAVHAGRTYDLEVDTSLVTAEKAVEAITAVLAASPRPSAFERMSP